MELIRISDCKLKIMLTQEDLDEFDLRADELDYADGSTRSMFRCLLHRVQRLTDFDTEGYRILVQLFPSGDGGCELFVTRLGEATCGEESLESREEVERILSRYERENASRWQRVFAFSTMAHLLQACGVLAGWEQLQESVAYRDEGGTYYLALTGEGDIRLAQPALALLGEYGEAVDGERTLLRLLEHGRAICAHRAVQTLCEL